MERDDGPPLRPLLLGMGWPSGQPGGLNRYFAGLYFALEVAGAEPTAVVLGPAFGAPSGVTVAAKTRATLVRRVAAYVLAARASAGVLDAHFALYALPVALLRRSEPLVVHFHGPWAEESRMAGRRAGAALRFCWERALYRRADRLVTLSDAFKRVLVERYGIAPWRVVVVPPGVELDRFSPADRAGARARLDLPLDGWVGVTARRLVPRMGVDVLLEAWAALPDALLVVAGDGPELKRLVARAAEPDLAGRVRFAGRVDDATLVDCYRAANVCIVPSIALEGYGLVVLEALACGTPVVTTDVGGLPEAIRLLGPELIVPAGDVGALAARLAGARQGTRPLPSAEECRAHAERHSWADVARRHIALYRHAAARERPFRVVYLGHTARLSGGELALLRLLPALDQVDAHVILAEDGPLVQRLRRAGISVEVLPLMARTRELRREWTSPGVPLALPALGGAIYAVRVARRLRELRPDIVHTNTLKSALYGGLAGRLAGIPVVWHLRDRIAEDYLPRQSVTLVRSLARRLPSAVVANSHTTLETIADALPAGVASVVNSVVMNDPVLPFDAVERRRRHGDLRVGIIGRIAPWKGQDLFLDAFARAFPTGGVRAVVVGAPLFGEHDYERGLHEQARALRISERVDFIGFVEDIATELRSLHVLVHASLIPEPFGQVVVEGLAAGTPVIAARAGGPAEIITDGVDGLLYDPGSPDALAAALLRIVDDDELRERLIRAGRERARAYAPEPIARELEAVYERVLAARQ